ncbi:hypothetical protein HPB51_010632 [Rhipicephalus microplus]|uniref:Ribosomal protein L15 n=1 Tax=Rhipicephalus microplus TaxID=6941 RepID=A0A9J6EPD8_RHIMP|nr:hypothetical protein HPB51_010632 [Rhipicephalus microplus]
MSASLKDYTADLERYEEETRIILEWTHSRFVRATVSDREILAAHCTCMAGNSEVCSHPTALLFYVEYDARYVIYRIRVRRGGRKKQVPKGCTYGKPKNHGVNSLKPVRNHQSIAEALRVLNSYWVAQDSTFKYYEVILVDPFHKAIRRDPKANWICQAVHKHRELRGLTSAGRKSRGLGKGHRYTKTVGGSRRACWKRRNTAAAASQALKPINSYLASFVLGLPVEKIFPTSQH